MNQLKIVNMWLTNVYIWAYSWNLTIEKQLTKYQINWFCENISTYISYSQMMQPFYVLFIELYFYVFI